MYVWKMKFTSHPVSILTIYYTVVYRNIYINCIHYNPQIQKIKEVLVDSHDKDIVHYSLFRLSEYLAYSVPSQIYAPSFHAQV